MRQWKSRLGGAAVARLRLPIVGLIAVGIVAGGGVLAADPAAAADRDCSDFRSQAAAQNYFEQRGPGDPDGLDADGDGVACEANPCPCSTGGGGGGDGGGNADVGVGPAGGSSGGRRSATVTSIADGDTISVNIRGRERDVRLIGIDTPEVYFGEECGGAAASASIKRMLSIGDRVRLVRDPSQDNRDHYDRLLRYVERRGRDINRAQVRKGWAMVYVFEAPFQRLGSYRRAEDRARSRDRGVWGRCGGDFHGPL